MRPIAPPKPSDLLAAMVVFTTSNGYRRLLVLLLTVLQLSRIPVPELLLCSAQSATMSMIFSGNVASTYSNMLRPAPTVGYNQRAFSHNPAARRQLTQQVAKLDRLLLEHWRPAGQARYRCGTHSLGFSCRRNGA